MKTRRSQSVTNVFSDFQS